jgi:succinyl-CoA synthetase beta subunit
MKKINEKLSEALDIEPIELSNTEIIELESKNTVDDDAEYARQNIRILIQKGNSAMDELLHVAKESEAPRAYEVAATLIKNLSDLNKDLLEIQKRKRDLRPVETTNNINVDKAVFVGSTKDLVKLLKSGNNE